jgi:CPA2 family monovalent cation:H+ antiporter-2
MTSIEVSDLAQTPLFAGLDDAELRVLAEWLEVEEAPPGHDFTHEGAAGYAFFVLHEGAAQVIVGGNAVRGLEAGDFFGEISILGGGRQTATVRVTTPAVVWTMFGTRFRQMQQEHPDLAATIERTAGERLATP